uniref:CA domain-containing protein n=1 Tax=Macrostomum lignano TaxID=282301 RepID=A0A1I8JPB7_9PLAT
LTEPERVDVLVLINDINDEQPSWPVAGNVIRVEFLDGDGPGKNKFILNAVDKDLGKNGRVSLYAVQPCTAEDNRLSLETSANYRREEKDYSYNMSLVAIDEGKPPLTGSIMLQFDRAFYTPPKPIYENEVVNSEVLQLQATDRDSGDYGTVVYDFAATAGRGPAGGQAVPGRAGANGRIIIRKPLDYDRMTKKLLSVIARDNARDKEYRKTATATVSISVLDRVDEAPTIETCFLPSGCHCQPSAPSIPEKPGAEKARLPRSLFAGPGHGRSPCPVGGLSEHGQEVPFILLSSSVNYGSSAPTDSTMKLFDSTLVTNRVFDREGLFPGLLRHRLPGLAASGRPRQLLCDHRGCQRLATRALEEERAERRPLPEADEWQSRARRGHRNNSGCSSRSIPPTWTAARLFEVNADTGQLRPLVVLRSENGRPATRLRASCAGYGRPASSPLTATDCTVTSAVPSTQTTRCAGRPEYRLRALCARIRPADSTVGFVEAEDEDEKELGNGAVAYRLDGPRRRRGLASLQRRPGGTWRAFKTSMPPWTGAAAGPLFVFRACSPRHSEGAAEGPGTAPHGLAHMLFVVEITMKNGQQAVVKMNNGQQPVFGRRCTICFSRRPAALGPGCSSTSAATASRRGLHPSAACLRPRPPRNVLARRQYRAHIVDRRDAAISRQELRHGVWPHLGPAEAAAASTAETSEPPAPGGGGQQCRRDGRGLAWRSLETRESQLSLATEMLEHADRKKMISGS